jgi:ribosomal protein S18 acetylase RimI-like enzyme
MTSHADPNPVTTELPITLAGPAHSEALAAFFKHQAIASPTMAYRVDRGPDYFAVCRLQGHDHRVLVAGEAPVMGTMTALFDRVYLNGVPSHIAYTADLRVAPEARGTGLADRLMREAVRVIREVNGPKAAIVTAVAADNPAGLKKNANLGRDGLTRMQPIGSLRIYYLAPFTPLGVVRPFLPYRVRPAHRDDLDAMAALWAATNSRKDLARAFTPEGFGRWVEDTPGLGAEAFQVAVDAQGAVRAFLGVWSPAVVRRFELAAESSAVFAVRQTWNALRPLAGLPVFPAPGQPLPFHAVTNACIPEADAEALPMLIEAALRKARAAGSLFLGLALDARDPLNRQAGRFFSSTSTLTLLGNEHLNPRPEGLFHVEMALG